MSRKPNKESSDTSYRSNHKNSNVSTGIWDKKTNQVLENLEAEAEQSLKLLSLPTLSATVLAFNKTYIDFTVVLLVLENDWMARKMAW